MMKELTPNWKFIEHPENSRFFLWSMHVGDYTPGWNPGFVIHLV